MKKKAENAKISRDLPCVASPAGHPTECKRAFTVSPKKLSRFVFVRTSSNFHKFR